MKTPILSVIIPTHNRPQFVGRAIGSALLSAPNGDVEVIVVPNGHDESWKSVAEIYQDDPRVLWYPLAKGHANVARNHGKTLARGKYIRFLDDDDTLNPIGAVHQIDILQRGDAEICSGTVEVIDQFGSSLRLMPQADQHDLFTAMARHERVCLPTAHVFNRSTLNQFEWDEAVDFEQDTEWMLRLASQREWTWVVTDQVVGYWTKHDSERTSEGITHSQRWQRTGTMLDASAASLFSREVLTTARREVLFQTLWHYIHQDFFCAPMYWSKKAQLARRISPKSRPAQLVFSYPGLRRISPLLIEWVMLPKRQLNRLLRFVRGDI